MTICFICNDTHNIFNYIKCNNLLSLMMSNYCKLNKIFMENEINIIKNNW